MEALDKDDMVTLLARFPRGIHFQSKENECDIFIMKTMYYLIYPLTW